MLDRHIDNKDNLVDVSVPAGSPESISIPILIFKVVLLITFILIICWNLNYLIFFFICNPLFINPFKRNIVFHTVMVSIILILLHSRLNIYHSRLFLILLLIISISFLLSCKYLFLDHFKFLSSYSVSFSL